jgi:hypothetical protein
MDSEYEGIDKIDSLALENDPRLNLLVPLSELENKLLIGIYNRGSLEDLGAFGTFNGPEMVGFSLSYMFPGFFIPNLAIHSCYGFGVLHRWTLGVAC